MKMKYHNTLSAINIAKLSFGLHLEYFILKQLPCHFLEIWYSERDGFLLSAVGRRCLRVVEKPTHVTGREANDTGLLDTTDFVLFWSPFFYST